MQLKFKEKIIKNILSCHHINLLLIDFLLMEGVFVKLVYYINVVKNKMAFQQLAAKSKLDKELGVHAIKS